MKIDFAPYTAPVIKTLAGLGIKSELSGRNDILVDGKKFSGNAQMANAGKLLHHGTLMVDVNIEAMVNALNVSELKISSKAIESVRSRVVNLKSMLPKGVGIKEFRDMLTQAFFEGSAYDEYVLTPEDKAHIKKRAEEHFGRDEYNYSVKFPFSIEKKKRFSAGIIDAGFDVKKGKIERIAFSGDFFANGDISELERKLCGVSFTQEALKERMKDIRAEDYIAALTNDELTELIFL